MIQRVCEQAALSNAAGVYVATDDHRIAEEVESFGGNVIMTRDDHESGTDRIQEAAAVAGIDPHDVVVNVQGDEPLIPPIVIDQVAALVTAESQMATLMEPIDSLADVDDQNVVKVVTDNDGNALYFSRACIPFSRQGMNGADPSIWHRHIGIYGFRRQFLDRFVSWPAHPLETLESLEQLRALGNGTRIKCEAAAAVMAAAIDVPSDVDKVLSALKD